jgi:DNA-binding NarL/FixJ family response regulator
VITLLEAPLGTDAEETALSLRRAAIAIDRAKRAARHAPDVALGYWKAMVDGQWSFIERAESDGRRILVAHPNEPSAQKLRALTDNERKVVSLVVWCHPSKLVAYELGYAESTVSELLTSALRKLGLKTRAELIEVHGAIASRGRYETGSESEDR